MTTRSAGKSEAARQLKEIRQINRKNHQMLHQQQKEEDKWKKDEVEHNIGMRMKRLPNLPSSSRPLRTPLLLISPKICTRSWMDMETDNRTQEEGDVRSPVKKCSGSNKTTSWRKGNCLVSPTKQESIPQAAPQAASFLDTFIHT